MKSRLEAMRQAINVLGRRISTLESNQANAETRKKAEDFKSKIDDGKTPDFLNDLMGAFGK